MYISESRIINKNGNRYNVKVEISPEKSVEEGFIDFFKRKNIINKPQDSSNNKTQKFMSKEEQDFQNKFLTTNSTIINKIVKDIDAIFYNEVKNINHYKRLNITNFLENHPNRILVKQISSGYGVFISFTILPIWKFVDTDDAFPEEMGGTTDIFVDDFKAAINKLNNNPKIKKYGEFSNDIWDNGWGIDKFETAFLLNRDLTDKLINNMK